MQRLRDALLPDYVVIGGGNAHRLRDLPEGVETRPNDNAFAGGFRLWDIENPETYQHLKNELADVDRNQQTVGNYLFYLAVPPLFFGKIISQLAAAGLRQEAGGNAGPSPWRRVVIEKPFGRDLESARALNREITAVLDESQIDRIDHYLGKETVQNILLFRFANGIFEPIWNRRYIDHVQITVAETAGVEHRGAYYETAGALRDMVPNHIFQLLALVGMESPGSFEAKRPGIVVRTDSVNMDFSYAQHFGPTTFVGYESLLYDCMTGDQTLFQRADFVEAGWRAITPILDVGGNLPARKFPNYEAGNWGPQDTDELIGNGGRTWLAFASLL